MTFTKHFDGTQVLYRLYDHHGRLMWVGITGVLSKRLFQHSYTWWAETIVKVKIQVFPERTAARSAELLALAEEAPVMNHMDTDRSISYEDRLTDEDRMRREYRWAQSHRAGIDGGVPWMDRIEKAEADWAEFLRRQLRDAENARQEAMEHIL